jgi:FAD binding domain
MVSTVHASNIIALLPNLAPGSEVFYPNDANWNETIQRWNAFEEPKFFASIRPGSVNDLQEIVCPKPPSGSPLSTIAKSFITEILICRHFQVRFATAHNISFLPSGAGHGFTTSYGTLQNGLEIDLSAFNSVVVDAAANTLTVGGGVKFGEIYEPLYSAGKEIRKSRFLILFSQAVSVAPYPLF